MLWIRAPLIDVPFDEPGDTTTPLIGLPFEPNPLVPNGADPATADLLAPKGFPAPKGFEVPAVAPKGSPADGAPKGSPADGSAAFLAPPKPDTPKANALDGAAAFGGGAAGASLLLPLSAKDTPPPAVKLNDDFGRAPPVAVPLNESGGFKAAGASLGVSALSSELKGFSWLFLAVLKPSVPAVLPPLPNALGLAAGVSLVTGVALSKENVGGAAGPADGVVAGVAVGVAALNENFGVSDISRVIVSRPFALRDRFEHRGWEWNPSSSSKHHIRGLGVPTDVHNLVPPHGRRLMAAASWPPPHPARPSSGWSGPGA